MRIVLSVGGLIGIVAYPAAVYYGLTHFGTRQLVLWLLPALALIGLARIPRARRERWTSALMAPFGVGLLIALAALFDDSRLLLATPVLINAGLLIAFAGSLHGETPLVERFARLQVDTLSPAEVRYCRQVTIVWSVFFVANGTIAGLLAVAAPLSWWALYTGLVAYVLLGALATAEYVIRKYRFGRFSDTPVDRVLQAVLPRRGASG
jgi:uncharacterized membrane protein